MLRDVIFAVWSKIRKSDKLAILARLLAHIEKKVASGSIKCCIFEKYDKAIKSKQIISKLAGVLVVMGERRKGYWLVTINKVENKKVRQNRR